MRLLPPAAAVFLVCCWRNSACRPTLLLLVLSSPCSIHETEEKYYADGEDAYAMRLTFPTGHAAAEKAAAAKAAAEAADKAVVGDGKAGSPAGGAARKAGKRR